MEIEGAGEGTLEVEEGKKKQKVVKKPSKY